MELGIGNFTEAGNNLMWRKGWRRYQREECMSKGYARMENKVHYDRIVDALTDNRSIDVLVDSTLKNVKKMPEKDFIIKYVDENRDKMTPEKIAVAIAIALDIPVDNTVKIKEIFAAVMEQLRNAPPILAEISIAVNDRPVEIIADDFGVRASENPISYQGVPSVVIDEISGEMGIQVWEGDNQSIVRGINPTDAGYRITEVPAQFSVPTEIPPELRGIRFNRQAIPDTNPLSRVTTSVQTEGEYPPPVKSSPEYLRETSVARFVPSASSVGINKIIQTSQTGDIGLGTSKEIREEFKRGGYKGGPESTSMLSLIKQRMTRSAPSPARPAFKDDSAQASGSRTPMFTETIKGMPVNPTLRTTSSAKIFSPIEPSPIYDPLGMGFSSFAP